MVRRAPASSVELIVCPVARRLAPILFVAAAIMVASAASNADSTPKLLWPQSIAFWTKSRGLLAINGHHQGAIETTSDGGRTWKVRYASRAPVKWVSVAGHR